MDHSQLYRFARFANILLFGCALALLLDQSTAAAFDRFEKVPHWRSRDRALVVVDKTGDAVWNDATRHAVDAWNAATAETGISLSWARGTGECRPDGTRIEVCQDPYQTLGGGDHGDREGLTDLKVGPDRSQAHIGSVTISVCSNCRLDPARRRVVATHEVGHALGLDHTRRIGSLMYPSGGPDRPDAGDALALRQLYAHVEDGDRCGAFDLEFGPFCF